MPLLDGDNKVLNGRFAAFFHGLIGWKPQEEEEEEEEIRRQEAE